MNPLHVRGQGPEIAQRDSLAGKARTKDDVSARQKFADLFGIAANAKIGLVQDRFQATYCIVVRGNDREHIGLSHEVWVCGRRWAFEQRPQIDTKLPV